MVGPATQRMQHCDDSRTVSYQAGFWAVLGRYTWCVNA